MTTVPVHGAAGVVTAPVRPTRPIRALVSWEARAEASAKAALQRWSIATLRIALGTVFVDSEPALAVP